MKDLALKIWEMPADDFTAMVVGSTVFIVIVYEILTEIRTNRVKRFNKR